MWITPQAPRDLQKLDHIQSPFPPLELGNVRLRPSQPLRQLLLCESGLLPCLDQQEKEALISSGVNRLHRGVPVEKPTYLINLKQVYPKTGFW